MASAQMPKLSVIVNNFNYEKFVATAIESLIQQSTDIEIIVVDDCSTDRSRDIISQYSDKIIPVFQEYNQGHGAAFNAGFARATGDMVMFLDSDDFMLPGGAEIIKKAYNPDVVMYHFRMRYADEADTLSGFHPALRRSLASGDVSHKLRYSGMYDGTVTSGLVYARWALDKVLPMDSEAFRQGGDGYLSSSVPLYGACASSTEAISAYRLHGLQHSKFSKDYAKRARWCLGHDENRHAAIAAHAKRLDLPVDANFKTNDYYNSYNRLVSLMFEPDLHPYPDDAISELMHRARKLDGGRLSGISLLNRRLFWGALVLAPMGLKKALLQLDIDPAARPGWLTGLVRSLRGFKSSVQGNR